MKRCLFYRTQIVILFNLIKLAIMKLSYFFIAAIFLIFACSSDRTETMYVSGNTVACTGVTLQECLQIKFNEADDYTLFYNSIEGFNHEKGSDYLLKVKRTEIKNPPADASKYTYSLIEIINKQPTPVTLEESSWLVAGIVNFNGKITREPIITMNPKLNEVNGSTGCNRFFGKVLVEQANITFQSIGTTRMACDDGGLEIAFLESLKNATTYKISNNVLMLEDAQGTILLKAVKTDLKE